MSILVCPVLLRPCPAFPCLLTLPSISPTLPYLLPFHSTPKTRRERKRVPRSKESSLCFLRIRGHWGFYFCCWCSFRLFNVVHNVSQWCHAPKTGPPRKKKGKQATGVTKNAGKISDVMETTRTIKKWGAGRHYDKKERKKKWSVWHEQRTTKRAMLEAGNSEEEKGSLETTERKSNAKRRIIFDARPWAM